MRGTTKVGGRKSQTGALGALRKKLSKVQKVVKYTVSYFPSPITRPLSNFSRYGAKSNYKQSKQITIICKHVRVKCTLVTRVDKIKVNCIAINKRRVPNGPFLARLFQTFPLHACQLSF